MVHPRRENTPMKKSLLAMLLALALLVPMAACDGTTGPDPTQTPVPTEAPSPTVDPLIPASNKIVTWIWNTEENLLMIDKFVQGNPEFEIDSSISTAGVWDDRSTDLPRLAAAVASGTGPDLFMTWNATAAYYSDLFMPLQEYFDLDPEFDPEDFDPQAFTLATFNDQIYFVPMQYSAHIFAWSKDLFEKAGMDPEVPPTNWTEFMDFARRATIKRPSGRVDSIGTEQVNFAADIWHIVTTGETFVDRTGLKFNWNRPSYVELFEFQRSIADTYGGNEVIGSTDNYNFLFYHNAAMSSYLPGWALRTVAKLFDTEVGISRIPMKDDQTEYKCSFEIGTALCIPRSAANPQGAWKLLKSLSTEGVIAQELKNYELNPVNYAPEYIFHTETREEFYTTFEPLLSEDLMARIKQRDVLMLEANAPYYKSPIHDEVIAYYIENRLKMFKFEITPQDLAIRMQVFSDSLIAEFIERKEAEGWTFDDVKGGIPPQR